MALYFGQVSLAALPANLLAAPAIAPIMWLGVVAAAAGQLAEPLAVPFTALAAPLLVYVQWVAHHTAATPLSVVKVDASPLAIAAGWATLAAATGVALRRWSRANLDLDGDASRAPRRHGRGRRRLALALVAAPAAALVLPDAVNGGGAPTPAADEVVVSFLDVGQGDATLIQRGRTTVAGGHRHVRRADPDAPRGGRHRAARRAGADARRGRPRGRRSGGDPRVHPAARRRRRRTVAVARPARPAAGRRRPPDRDSTPRRPATSWRWAGCGSRSCGRRRAAPAGGRPAIRTTTRWSRGSRPAGSRCCSPRTPRAA